MSKQRWLLPTNTENLEIFLSSGLMTCVIGLGNAYEKDIMADYCSGYIPFFSINNLKVGIEKSTLEDDNLIRCVIELDLSQILSMSMYAHVKSDSGNLKEDAPYIKLGAENIKDGDDQYENLLIPSPLPIQCIKNIIFESNSIKNDVTKGLERKFSSYPGNFFKTEVSIFKSLKQSDDLLNHAESVDDSGILARDVGYNKIFSLGGMLALTFYQSKNGMVSVNHFKEICSLKEISKHSHLDFELLNNYFYDTSLNGDKYNRLFFGLVKLISLNRGSVSEIKFEILNYLDTTENCKDSAVRLGKKLRDLEERVDNTSPDDVFTKVMESYASKSSEENKKVYMLLVMYFFRDKIETMLKFYHANFQDIDYILFAMFFGAGSRYVGLPSQVKNIKGLDFYISNRMAEYHHQLSNGELSSFKAVNPPKFIISDLIKEKSNGDVDNFVNWFSDDFLSLDRDKFQSWEISSKGFSCVSKTKLRFNEEPVLATKIRIDEIKNQVFDFCSEMKGTFTKKLIESFSWNSERIQEWELTNKGFSCDTTTKLTFIDKPKLIALIDIPEFERQITLATIGNDKELFNYNEVYSKYEKSKE